MVYTAEALAIMPHRVLDAVFAEVVFGRQIVWDAPFGVPGIVTERLEGGAEAALAIPTFCTSFAYIDRVQKRILDLGFHYILTASQGSMRCRFFKDDTLLHDLTFPYNEAPLRALVTASILAIQAQER